MKKVALLGAALGLSAVIASCGLIPPVKFANPVGMSGQTMTAALSATDASLRPQVAGAGTATVTASFADTTQSIPFTPSAFNVTLAISSVGISQNCAPAAAASTIGVTLTNFQLTVADGAGQSVRSVVTTVAGPITFNITNAGVISGLNPAALLFLIPAANIAGTLNIIQTAPTPNSVTASANVATSPALSGCSLTFTFGAGEGEVKL